MASNTPSHSFSPPTSINRTPLHIQERHIHTQTSRPNLIIGSSHCRITLPINPAVPSPNRAPFDKRTLQIANVDARSGRRAQHIYNSIFHPTHHNPTPPHFTTPREVVVIFLGGNDLANLATDQHLKNALLNPDPPLNKLLIQITIFNITSRLIDIYNYFKAFCKHVKICKLIRRPSMSDFLKPLVIAINSQLNNRLPSNTLIDTYNSITTHYICSDRTHLKKSGQDLLYRKIKHAILNP